MPKDQKPSGGCNNCGSTEKLQLSNGEWLCADCLQEIAEEEGDKGMPQVYIQERPQLKRVDVMIHSARYPETLTPKEAREYGEAVIAAAEEAATITAQKFTNDNGGIGNELGVSGVVVSRGCDNPSSLSTHFPGADHTNGK